MLWVCFFKNYFLFSSAKPNLFLSYVLFSLQKSTKRLATGYYIFVICRFNSNDIRRCRSSLFHQQMSKYSVYGCEFSIKSHSPIYGVSLVHLLKRQQEVRRLALLWLKLVKQKRNIRARASLDTFLSVQESIISAVDLDYNKLSLLFINKINL